MLKYCLFLGLSFCVAAAAAPIERLRLELPETSDAGLRQSAGVFLRRMKARVPQLAEAEAVSAAPKAGELLVKILPYFPAEKSPGPEGYRLRIASVPAGGVVAEVTGADRLGTLFGLGALYRKTALDGSGFSVDACDETSAPRYELRSVNQGWPVNMDSGMRTGTGARKWEKQEGIDYQEELILQGMNGYTHGWGGGMPVVLDRYKGEKKQVSTFVMDFCDEYGLNYVLSHSINGIGRDNMKPEWRALLFRYRSWQHACPSIPEARETMIRGHEIAARHTPRIDYVMLLPGDVAGCDCGKCRPWALTYYQLAVETAQAIHKYHPKAKVFFSNQEFRTEANRLLFDRFYRDKSPEFAGYAYGPGSSENSFYGYVKPNPAFDRYPGVYPGSAFLKSRLNYLAPGQQVLAFMDIGHWKRSQTGVAELDPAWSETYERRSFNACPVRLGRVWREVLPYIEHGIGYSESIFDDFSKFFTLRLLWSPEFSDRQITREYAAFYCGENVAELLTDAIFLHERNVEQAMLPNGENILKCHRMVEEAYRKMAAPYRRNNWRFDLFRQRAAFDAWMWIRMDAQKRVYDRVLTQLSGKVPSAGQVKRMIAELEEAGRIPALKPYREIMQRTDDALDAAAGLRSIALKRLDSRPDQVGAGWLIARLKEIAAAPDEAAARKLCDAVVNYDRVGELEYYDNCGTPGEMPHFDPKSGEVYYGSGRMVRDSRPSQRSYNFSSEALDGLRFVYPAVDPKAAYKVEFTYPNPDGVTFALNSPNEFEVYANGRLLGRCVPNNMHFVNPTSKEPGRERRLLSPASEKPEDFTRFSLDIPAEVTASGGEVAIEFRKVPGRAVSTCISEIWLKKR